MSDAFFLYLDSSIICRSVLLVDDVALVSATVFGLFEPLLLFLLGFLRDCIS